jgi:hypothetical protein
MATAPADGLRFIPSAVKGLSAVTEVAVFPDRLELLSAGEWVRIRFFDIARWYRHGWLYRPLAWLGWGIRGWPSVADRDWFHPPAGRFFRFYTEPPVTVYLPDEPPETSYGQTIFRRVQEVMAKGGFASFDLGWSNRPNETAVADRGGPALIARRSKGCRVLSRFSPATEL